MHKKSITCATEFKRKFAVQPHLHPYGFCGGLQMSVAGRTSIGVLESNSSDNQPSCSIIQERGETMPSVFCFYIWRTVTWYQIYLYSTPVPSTTVNQVNFWVGDIHYWTDSTTSQHRSKAIFKIVSCHYEYTPPLKIKWRQATEKVHVTQFVGLQNEKLIWL